MIIETSQGNVEIDLQKHNKIFLQLSGGLDSAALLYVLAENYHKDLQIHCITVPYTGDPSCGYFASLVLQYIKDKFQIPIGHTINSYFGRGHEKVDKMIEAFYPFYKQGYVLMNSVTSNPDSTFTFNQPPISYIEPRDQIKPTNGIYSKGLVKNYIGLSPFAHIDKKVIREIMDQRNISQDLVYRTRSCTNKNYIRCHQCWWCQERDWAFGDIDKEYIWK